MDEKGQRKTLAKLMSGKSLFGKEGAFGPLLQRLLEAALEGELAGHLAEEQASDEAVRNGHSVKQLRTNGGTIDLVTPRVRARTFRARTGAQASDHTG